MTALYKILVLFIIAPVPAYAQTDSLRFSVTTYYTGSELYKTDTVSVKNTEQVLDVYFYKEHFYMFYGLSKKLIQKKHKDQEIVEWSKKDQPKDDMGNWSDSYTYDSRGRLIEYEYSSCGFCSQFPWGYTLVYDENNNVIEQQTYFLSSPVTFEEGKPIRSLKLLEQIKESILLTYDTKGNIIVLEEYNHQGIRKKIQLLN